MMWDDYFSGALFGKSYFEQRWETLELCDERLETKGENDDMLMENTRTLLKCLE